MSVLLRFASGESPFECRSLRGHERLGGETSFDVELFSSEIVDATEYVGRGCALILTGDDGATRTIDLVVTEATSSITAQSAEGRLHRMTLQSAFALLSLRRTSRIFQELALPDIIKTVVSAVYGDDTKVKTTQSHPVQRYVVQYQETDAAFVRRLCEESGCWFHFVDDGGRECFVLEDDSTHAAEPLGDALPQRDPNGTAVDGLHVADPRRAARRRTGACRLRDYRFETPNLALEGTHTSGSDSETALEHYEAPGGAADQKEIAQRAKQRLEALRVDADVLGITTNAVALGPGAALRITTDEAELDHIEGSFFVTTAQHVWEHADHYRVRLGLIPLAVPFRLPCVTPRPTLPGVQPATVTGASGQEIHTDEHGCVRVHFYWDRSGIENDRSSLPIRAMQPNMPGSMVLPRVGWEVAVAFEDGDPDRPFVLGRVYNAKTPPPLSLPGNKTVTAIRTYSSPGGGGVTGVQIDDAAGKQHLQFQSAFDRSITVANDAHVQTAKSETITVAGSQTRNVSGNEKISVSQQWVTAAASQSATVGATQKVFVKGNMSVKVSSETVLVGGAVLEKVGNPVAGAANLAFSAALAGVGSLGAAGSIFATGAGYARGAIDGYRHGGLRGAAAALGSGVAGQLAGMVPGGDALFASVTSSGTPMPWQPSPQPPGDRAPEGGTASSDASSSAAGPGPGHRKSVVNGAMTELIGGAHSVLTPGNVMWFVTGTSTHLVGGAHSIRTSRQNIQTLGASTETLGSLQITSKGDIGRQIRGTSTTTIAGSLSSRSTNHSIKSNGTVNVQVSGSMTIKGGKITFACGDSKVTITSSDVTVEATNITIKGASTQSGKTDHG